MKTRCFPGRSRRGLGLFDSILAFAVVSLVLLWGSQILSNWVAGRAIANDARAVAELARAGRLLIEGDITHPGRALAVGEEPCRVSIDIPLDPNILNTLGQTNCDSAPYDPDLPGKLAEAGLWSPALGTLTPGRRALSLWLYKPSDNVLLIMARARGGRALTRIPGAEDGVSGVGVLLNGSSSVIGPGLNFDLAAISNPPARFTENGDLFALDYVALDVTCRTYLYRQEVDCDGDGTNNPEIHRMAVNLDMGGNDLTNVGEFEAPSATIGVLDGDTRIDGALSVSGELNVDGATNLSGDLTLGGTLSAPNVTIEDALTVRDQLRVEGTLTGQTLTFNEEATVSGTARIGTLNITSMTTEELRAGRIDIETGEITDLRARDLTVTTCTGCN